MEIRTDHNIDTFIATLEKATIAKVLRTIDLLEKFGHQLGAPHSKKVKNSIFELRIRGRQEVRVLYIFHQQTVVLLHGFVKKSDKMPRHELEQAISKMRQLT